MTGEKKIALELRVEDWKDILWALNQLGMEKWRSRGNFKKMFLWGLRAEVKVLLGTSGHGQGLTPLRQKEIESVTTSQSSNEKNKTKKTKGEEDAATKFFRGDPFDPLD